MAHVLSLTSKQLAASGRDAILASPKVRARETAEIVARMLHRDVQVDPRLGGPLELATLEAILAESFDRLDELHKDKGKIRGVATGFRALEDCTTVVVKTPSVPGDKYVVG